MEKTRHGNDDCAKMSAAGGNAITLNFLHDSLSERQSTDLKTLIIASYLPFPIAHEHSMILVSSITSLECRFDTSKMK
jgi:hypothetical protein